MAKRVVVLGGGSGGLATCNKLVRTLLDEAEVTLIDRRPHHEFMPAYPWVAFGIREPDQIRRPLSLLRKKGVNFIQAEVKSLEVDDSQVVTDQGTLDYDYLVVSLGAEIAPGKMEGIEASYNTWTLEGSLELRDRLKRFEGGRIAVGVSSLYYPCPPAPFEVAGMVEFAMKTRGIRDRCEIDVFHVLPAPLANMGPLIADRVGKILQKKGIRYHGDFQPVRVEGSREDGGKVVAADGREIFYDLLLMTPPFAPHRLVRESPLAGENGFPNVQIDTFRAVDYPNIFVIGDTVNPSLNMPPAGVVAHFQGEFVVGVIASHLKGAYIGEAFNPVAMCIMDFGDDALLPSCDFTNPLRKRGAPSCSLLASGKWVRVAKMAFEAYWFATLLS